MFNTLKMINWLKVKNIQKKIKTRKQEISLLITFLSIYMLAR